MFPLKYAHMGKTLPCREKVRQHPEPPGTNCNAGLSPGTLLKIYEILSSPLQAIHSEVKASEHAVDQDWQNRKAFKSADRHQTKCSSGWQNTTC